MRWVNYGLFDVLEYLGLDQDLVRGDVGEADPLTKDWDDVKDGEDVNTVLSVRTASSSLVLHGLGSGGLLEDLLAAGPDEILAGAHPRTSLAPGRFPMSGLHLDVSRREAGYWTSDYLGDPADPPRWPGWAMTCWLDRHEEQLAHTGAALRLPVPAQAEITTQILGFLASRAPPRPEIEPDVLLRRQKLAAGLAALGAEHS